MAGERILVIDDEPGVREALAGILADEGFHVSLADSGESGLEALEHGRFDAILLDVWLPGIDGLETLEQIRERVDDCQVVMISGHGTIETAVRATKLGAFDFVEKPLSLEKTLLVLRNALRQRRLERRNRQLLDQLSRETEIVGDSAAAAGLRGAVELAAVSDVPVALRGEPGSGREMLARRIHTAGPRHGSAFVAVSCAALDASGMGRLLIGDGDGGQRVEMARGGTLMLEDVDTLDPPTQLAMATVVSSADEPAVAVRWMATLGSWSPLRPELAERLAVMRVEVPALRERRDDIPSLFERSLTDMAREYGRACPAVSSAAMARLKAYHWPGNLRQLRNVVEQLLLAPHDGPIDVSRLPADLGGAREPVEDLYGQFATLGDGIAAFERYYVARTIHECEGDNDLAARRLGITVDELSRRLAVRRR